MKQDSTEHGKNIAAQIQEEDAYGETEPLNYADVYIILDELHSHFVNLNDKLGYNTVTKLMRVLEEETDLNVGLIL